MGVFERFGEKVERFKQEAVAAREDSVEYRCRDCGEGFYSERETCPECGSSAIGRVARETKAETEAEVETEAETNADSNAASDADTASDSDTNSVVDEE